MKKLIIYMCIALIASGFATVSAEDTTVLKIQPKEVVKLDETADAAGANVEENKKAPDADDDKMTEVKPVVKNIHDRYHNISNPAIPLSQTTQVGEKLVYQVRWKALPAGTVTMKVKRKSRIGDRKAFNLEMHLESNDFLSTFYEVDSVIKSLADTDSGASYLFKRDLREGSRRVDDRLEFDYDNKDDTGIVEPVSRYSKVKDGTTRPNTPRPIPGVVQDSLSVVYFMRHLQFNKPGDAHQFLIGSRKQVDIVTLTAKEFRIFKSPLGKFDCIVIEPKGQKDTERTNIVSAKGEADVLIEKNTGIVLYMAVAVPFGKATATLIEAEKTDLLKYKLPDENITEKE